MTFDDLRQELFDIAQEESLSPADDRLGDVVLALIDALDALSQRVQQEAIDRLTHLPRKEQNR